MIAVHSPPVPRNGHTFEAGIVARISGCANQKEISLDDQIVHSKEDLEVHGYCEPMNLTVIKTKAKGERLDRPELEEISSLLNARKLDVLIMEDVGRLIRGAAAVEIIGIAVDNKTRVLAPNDGIDSWESTWESDVTEVCADHVSHNEHTSKRIKHKTMVRFLRNGGCPARPIYGFKVPAGAKSYQDWERDPEATPIVEEMYRRLLDDHSYGMIADYLNMTGISLGPYARRNSWEGKMVRRILLNPLMCGKPQRGRMRTEKIFATGRRVSRPNPAGPKFFAVPHLAHVTEEAFQRAAELVASRANTYARKPINGEDPLARVPRKDSRFPGRLARCWYCGRHFVWGGNGVSENLQCAGSREWKCWNSVGICGELVTRKVVELITAELFALPGLDEQYARLVTQAQQDLGGSREQRLSKVQQQEAELARQGKHITDVIRQFGANELTQQLLSDWQQQKSLLARQKQDLLTDEEKVARLPAGLDELRTLFEKNFLSLAANSAAFAHQLRRLVTRMDIYLVRLIDGDKMSPRARVQIALDGITPCLAGVSGVGELLRRDVTFDLFDPPQREAIREAASALNDGTRTQDQIVELLPERPTSTAVQRALALDQQMKRAGLVSPYVLVEGPSGDGRKLRRHLHPRYKFELADGYQPLAL